MLFSVETLDYQCRISETHTKPRSQAEVNLWKRNFSNAMQSACQSFNAIAMVEHIREERGGKVLFNLQASLVHHILKQYKSGNGPRLDVAQFVTHLQRAYGRIWREDIEASVLEGHLTTIVAAAVSSVEWWQQELDSRRFDVDFAMAQWLQTWLVWLLPAIPWNYWNYNQKPIKVLDDLLEEDFAQTMHGITSSLLAQVERNEVEESSQAGKAESGDH